MPKYHPNRQLLVMLMRLRTNCPDCLSKNSMISVIYLDKMNKTDKTAFYICQKCSSLTNLEKIPFSNQISMFEVLVLRGSKQHEIEAIQKPHTPTCIKCKNSEIIIKQERRLTIKEAKKYQKNNPDRSIEYILSHTSQLEDVKKKCIVKLFIQAERLGINRQFAGYLCASCKTIFFIKNLPKIDWKISGWKNELGDYLLNKKDLNFMSPGVKFGTLGSYATRSAPIGREEETQTKIPRITKAQIRKIVREELAQMGLTPKK